METFVEITPKETEVTYAYEYQHIKYKTKLQPEIKLFDGKNNYTITDRYILYRFLRCLDPELRYLDMMLTIYDMGIDERPTLADIIQGYLYNTNTEKVSMWVDGEKIVLVEDENNTYSKYFQTTMDYIGANFLPDYVRSMRYMKAGNSASLCRSFPVMVFTKVNALGRIKIEIISYNQKTFIAGRYRPHTQQTADTGKTFWVQPRPVGFCPRWAHLIPHTALKVMLDDFRVLEKMGELTKGSTLVGGGGASDRLDKWSERNNLEAENMYRFDRKTIDELNYYADIWDSFSFEEE